MAGALTISLEIELAWGTHDKDSNDRFDHISPRREVETKTLNNLLKLCDDLELPITFDVVGHLFLSSCDGSHPSPHEGDWFASDPGTDEESNPLFYAPDMVKNIRDAKVDHELRPTRSPTPYCQMHQMRS